MALAISLTSAIASAQPVNVQGGLKKTPVSAGWSGFVQGSFALSKGNVDLVDVGGGTHVEHVWLYPPGSAGSSTTAPPYIHHRVFARGDGRFSEKADTLIVSQTFIHLRWTAMWHPIIGSEIFLQHSSNEFQLLANRGVIGTGARLELVHSDPLLVALGSGYMLELERIDVPAGAPDEAETVSHRWTNYLSARLALFEAHLLLQSTLYVQPRFDEIEDFRLLEELEVAVAVTEHLSLGFSMSVAHDHAPPTGVERTDLKLQNNVRFSF